MYVQYDPKKAKKYGLKDDADFIERFFLRKYRDPEWIDEVHIDFRAFNNRMHILVEIYYDPNQPGVEDKFTWLEQFFSIRVPRAILVKVPKTGESES